MTNKPTGRASSIPKGLIMGGIVSMIVTIATALVLTYLLHTEALLWDNIGYGIMLLVLLASFLGTVTACAAVKHQILLISFLSGTFYLCLLLSITALFFGGQYEAVGVTAILIFGGSGTAGLLSLRRIGESYRKNQKQRFKKRKYAQVR